MENLIKINVDFNNEAMTPLLSFIEDTQNGKFTEEKPIIANMRYTRMNIQEQGLFELLNENNQEELLLFGISG